MTFKIITAEERLAAPRTAKIVVFGPSGIGKTSLLRGLTAPSLLIDMEAGDMSLADWTGDSIKVRQWEEARDLACLIGGPNLALPATEPYSLGHFEHVESKLGKREDVLAKYALVFWDSITVLSRLCMDWAERHEDNNVNKGGKIVRDTRGAYGMMGREVLKLLTHVQHTADKHIVLVGILDRKTDDFNRTIWEAQMEGSKIGRELPGIVDEVFTMQTKDDAEGVKHRVFYTQQNNAEGYPAKDRSGKLDPIEPANLQHILDKMGART
jgi:hypothetical protein